MNIGSFVRRFRAEPPVPPGGIDHEVVAEAPPVPLEAGGPVVGKVGEREEPVEADATIVVAPSGERP